MAAASTVEAHLKDGTYQEFDDVSGEDVIEYYAKVAVEYARVKYPAVLTRGAVK